MKIKIPPCEEKITKIKRQMNEHEISIHVTIIHDFKLYSLSLQLENIK